MNLKQGTRFAGYTILRFLGAGGMGELYLAQHPRLPRRDALKLLNQQVSADPGYRNRFLREADLASTLWHPNIVGVHDRGENHGRLWIAMDYVDGTDAAQLLARRYPAGMPVELVSEILTAVASALDHAHRQGLLHRDVKPANILLSDPNNAATRRILLTDFGIARQTDDPVGLTTTNTTLGTVAYAAPEQLAGDPIDRRADQYSLAATAYQLLTGRTPYPFTNPAVVIGKQLTAPPPAISELMPNLRALDEVLAAALAKKPDDRYNSCADFTRAFHEQSGQLAITPASAPTTPAPLRTIAPRESVVDDALADSASQNSIPPVRRRRSRIVVLSAIAIVAVAISVTGFLLYRDAQKEPAPLITLAASLNGTYKLTYESSKRTLNGSPSPKMPEETSWWAFRSICRSDGCTATGVALDASNHAVRRDPPDNAVLYFRDGTWQDSGVRIQVEERECLGVDGDIRPGVDTEHSNWTLSPQKDSQTLQGIWRSTVITNECGFAGLVGETPVTAVRVGDVASSVDVPDPAGIDLPPIPSLPSTPEPGSPSLEGSYRLDHEVTNVTVNGVPATGALATETSWWAYKSRCIPTRCIATGSQMDETLQKPAAGVNVLTYKDGAWENSPIPFRSDCPTGGTHAATATWRLTPQTAFFLRGTFTLQILSNECKQQGTTYQQPVTMTRVGDLPPSAVLADPDLFLKP